MTDELPPMNLEALIDLNMLQSLFKHQAIEATWLLGKVTLNITMKLADDITGEVLLNEAARAKTYADIKHKKENEEGRATTDSDGAGVSS